MSNNRNVISEVKNLFGIDIPVASVPLPSKGMVYPKINENEALEKIDIRSMTSHEENILHSKAMLKSGKAISTIIKDCILSKDINIDDLLLGDKNALLIAIRVASYGSTYRTDIKCPECDEKAEISFDLSNLKIKRLGAEPIEANKNIFSFILPGSKKEIHFGLLTGKDQEEVELTKERLLKSGKAVEDPITIRLKHQVISIGGNPDKNIISKMIEFMPAADSLALREYISDIEPDIEMKQFQQCPKCREDIELVIPFDIGFFWPNKRIF